MNKIKITTTLATAMAAVTLAYGQPNSNRYEVYETKFTVDTSDIKSVSVKLLAPVQNPKGTANAKGVIPNISAVSVPYRAPIKKTYTVLMAYDHGQYDSDGFVVAGQEPRSYGRMWAGDKRQAVKVRAATEAELKTDDTVIALGKPTYDGGLMPTAAGGHASPIGQKGLEHSYFAAIKVTDSGDTIKHAVPASSVWGEGAEIVLRGLATHRVVKTKAKALASETYDGYQQRIQYAGMAARSRASMKPYADYSLTDFAAPHPYEIHTLNTVTGVAFGEGFYPVRPAVLKSPNPVQAQLHMEQGLGHAITTAGHEIPDNYVLTDKHLGKDPAVTELKDINSFDAVYQAAANVFMPKANLLSDGETLNPAHFYGSFTTKRNDAVLNAKISFGIDTATNKPLPARLPGALNSADYWDELTKVIDFRVPAAQR